MQIRVTRLDGGPLSWRRALVRLAWMVLSLPLFWGYLPVLFTARRRAAFDLLAGTVVTVAPPAPGTDGVSPPQDRRAQASGIVPPSVVP